MSKETKTTKQTKKQPKTIKVLTLVKVAVATAVILGVYFAGHYVGAEGVRNHNLQVKSEAQTLVSDLKSSQAK